jgi:hypothetical protein
MKTISLVVILAATLSIADLGLAQQPCKSTVVRELRMEQFQSKIFDRMITVRIWLPAGYNDMSQATRKYPTLYMLATNKKLAGSCSDCQSKAESLLC